MIFYGDWFLDSFLKKNKNQNIYVAVEFQTHWHNCCM